MGKRRTAFDDLFDAAEARGFRVLLHLEDLLAHSGQSIPFTTRPVEGSSRLSRLAVVDRDRDEVAALPLREGRSLDEAAAVLVEYLSGRVS